MPSLTPESYPSTLGVDASEAGAIQIFDASRLTGISFKVLAGLYCPSSDVRQRGEAPIFEVWPRIGSIALEEMLANSGATLDVSRLDSAAKREAFPWLSVPERQLEAIAA